MSGGENVSFRIVRDRKARMEYLLEVRKEHPDWPESRLVAYVAYQTGVKPYTIRSYISLLKEAGEW
jgi:hypothetical protein